MARYLDHIAPDLTNTNTFGQIIKKISAGMDAVGLVKTADTGQIVVCEDMGIKPGS